MKDKEFWKRVQKLSGRANQMPRAQSLHYFGYVPTPQAALYADDSDFSIDDDIDEDFREGF